MDVLTAAARALYMVEHPGAPEDTWDKLSRRTQMYYAVKVAPVAQSVAQFWENH